MKRNHLKLLTDEERKEFNDLYEFEFLDGFVIVHSTRINRTAVHRIDEPFILSPTGTRKIKISTEAIELWIQLDFKYSLIDIQQAINRLYVSYQEQLTKENIEQQLKQLNA